MKKRNLVWLLAPMVVALPLAIDVNIPAFPGMAVLFGVSAGVMQLALTLFMLAAGGAQLIVGPLSDHYGRKPILYLAAFVFALGITLCASVHSIAYLILSRIIEAMGSCGLLVLSFAIVRDLFHGKESGECYSYLNGIIAFSPIFGPSIGSFIDIYFGWRATFWFLFVVVFLVLLSTSIGLPETLPVERRIPIKANIFKEYWQILTHRVFALYTFVSATGLLYFYLFCSMSPYIIIRLLHIPEEQYGYYFAFMGTSLFLGSFFSSYVIARMGVERTCILGCFMSLVGGLIMVGWYFITGLTINNFIWPMLIIGIGGTFSMGAGTGRSMEPFGETAGAAAGLGGALRFLSAGVIGSILITKNISSTLPLSLAAIIFGAAGLILLLARKKLIRRE